MPGPVTGEDLAQAVDDLIEAFETQMAAFLAEAAALRALIALKADASTQSSGEIRNTIEENVRFQGERLATEIAIAKMPRRQRLGRHGVL